MVALEVAEAVVRRSLPEGGVREERFDLRGALPGIGEHGVDGGADIDGRDRRHAARPGLQEYVRHAFVYGSAHQKARAVEPRLDLRKRQEADEFDVRHLGGAIADRLVEAGLQALAADARAADHHEAPLGQPLRNVEEHFGTLVAVNGADPQYAV